MPTGTLFIATGVPNCFRVSSVSSTHGTNDALQRGSTAALLLPSEDPPHNAAHAVWRDSTFSSERSPRSGEESPRGSQLPVESHPMIGRRSHDDQEHASASATRSTSPPDRLARTLSSDPARLPSSGSRHRLTPCGPRLTRASSDQTPARAPSETPSETHSEARIRIVWQPPSASAIVQEFFPEHADAFPSLVFSAKRGGYWSPPSV
ncbi:hypothetical protein T484DRAFT_1812415 [Baffinella frigidus]|nr:hypothetical protein T484DRAFT_1812415 [Cryptophyta sp. CCMP2293]